MKPATRKLLYWSPRVLGLLFALFTVIFAFDVFDENQGFWPTALALALHLVPTAILFLCVFIAWRKEWIGAILFFGLAVLYVVWAWGRFPLSVYFVMAGPMALTGILFLLNWIYRSELHPPAATA